MPFFNLLQKPKAPILSLAVITAITFIPVTSSLAQQTTPAPNTTQQQVRASGWQVQCNNNTEELRCAAYFDLISEQNNQRLLRLSVQQPRNQKDRALVLQLPLGLYLPAGVQLAIDDERSRKMDIQTCNKNGCFINTPLKKPDLDRITAADRLSIVIQAVNRREIRLTLPMNGFQRAAEKIQ